MLLPFERALETVMNTARLLGAERVGISRSANRILAEDVKSDIDMPPFNKSARDGFACRRTDLTNELTVIETIPAGYVPRKTVGANHCAKIMTGAIVPEGADCVVMKEYVENPSENTARFIGEKTSDNICRKGEDIEAGDIVLREGSRILPQHIAVLASLGQVEPVVTRCPRVAVIATGDELVEPASMPGPSQIRNSNSPQLIAQLERAGAIATSYGIAKDADIAIDYLLKQAIGENDVVVISGGVSVGDFDYVPKILRQNGVDLLFEKIAIKPGKPTVFGTSNNVYCFGLPGNPVSTFVLFEILVKPFLYKLMGHHYRPCTINMPLGRTIKAENTQRPRWVPVAITQTGAAEPTEYHGSAHIRSLCFADGLIKIDAAVAEVEEGTVVEVRLI